MSDRDRAERIIEALGGKANITALDSCITRLRLVLRDPGAVDEKRLKALGAIGVIRLASSVQVIMGTASELIESEMKAVMQPK
ncbi:MAG: glucose PTS transporter subunit EIIB [Ignavibacteriales bacterium]